MRALLTRITKVASLGLTALALASCGGGDGGDGGYTTRPLIDLKITANPSTLPVNTLGVSPQPGGPYTNLITVTVTQDGRAYPAPSVSIDLLGPNGTGALYYIDGNPEHETCETNTAGVETCVPNAYRRMTFDETSGYVTGHFHAWGEPGTVEVVASVSDPNTGQTVSKSASITVGSTANTGVPGNVAFANTPTLYIQGQNRNDSATLTLSVTDDGGFKINAPAGVNNLLVELLDSRPNGGEYLAAKGAAGNQTGSSVKTYSGSGVADVVLHAGTRPGTVLIKATADRSDNNVDNGIQSPISTVATLVIGSGQVTSLTFTGPYAGAVHNYWNALAQQQGEAFDLVTGVYLRRLAVVAADDFGNPPPAGTPITFRLIDSPAVGYPDNGRGTFVVAGNDGNPQEGGSVFTTKTTIPTTTGCPATNAILIMDGLRPYQSGSRIITGFNPPTTLSVNNAFYDWQADTGFSVPYVVGCVPQYGNVDLTATTDENGIAFFEMRYPTTMLGHNFILSAEAAGGKTGAVMQHWYLGFTVSASLWHLSDDDADNTTPFVLTLANPTCDDQLVCVYSGSTSQRFQMVDGNLAWDSAFWPEGYVPDPNQPQPQPQPLPAELVAVELRANPTQLATVTANILKLEQKINDFEASAANTDGDTSAVGFTPCDLDTAAGGVAGSTSCDQLKAKVKLARERLTRLLAVLEALKNPSKYITIVPNPIRTSAGGLASATITATNVPAAAQYDVVFGSTGATQSEPNNPLLSNSVVITIVAPGTLDDATGL